MFAAIHTYIFPSYFSTISLFIFLDVVTPGCVYTSEYLELGMSDVRQHARFLILYLVTLFDMIISIVTRCKAHDVFFFKHLK